MEQTSSLSTECHISLILFSFGQRVGMVYSNLPAKRELSACWDGGAVETQSLVFSAPGTFIAHSCNE
jgi:hypothetical protein